MKIRLTYRHGKSVDTDVANYTTNKISEASADGQIESMDQEIRNHRDFLGKLTEKLVEKNILSLDELKELLDVQTIEITKL